MFLIGVVVVVVEWGVGTGEEKHASGALWNRFDGDVSGTRGSRRWKIVFEIGDKFIFMLVIY